MERAGFHGYRKNLITNNTNSGSNNDIPMTIDNSNSHSNNSISSMTPAEESECTVREQDRFMPIANVIRIMRKILPPHAKISDDAKETIQEYLSEYISFITGEANERCQREQRKTITTEDVLWAMSKLGFDDYIEPLTLFLHRYRETEGDRTGAVSPASSAPGAPAFSRWGPLDYAMPPFAPYGAAVAPPPGYYPSMNGFYNYYKDAEGAGGSSSGGGGRGSAGSGQAQGMGMGMGGGAEQQHRQFK